MNKIYEGLIIEARCIELSYDGLGVFRIDNYPILIKDFFPGEIATIKILSVYAKYALGTIIKFLNISKERNNLQIKNTDAIPVINLNYKSQLYYKNKYLSELLKRNLAENSYTYQNIIPSDLILNYRNKAKYVLKTLNNRLIKTSFIKDSTNTTEEVSNDLINDKSLNYGLEQILTTINNYFYSIDKIKNLNFFKEIILRINKEQKMQALIKLHSDFDLPRNLINELRKLDFLIDLSVIKNNKIKQVILKNDFIMQISNQEFKLSIDSFFQVNINIAAKIFAKIKEINIKNNYDIIFDLFCGTGVISSLIANKNQMIIGIDIVKNAIENAKINAKNNHLNNFKFYTNDVFKSNEILSKYQSNSVLSILDPPRNGLSEKLINFLNDSKIENIIYISCNPRSLIRDLKIFQSLNYQVKFVQGFDMFPNTFHIETLCLLTKIKNN
ncbi:23S rRNA (uracil(1939)-C(5))-methyltransferase RlmD [Mycoplasmopsis canis]|uniref:23S rRNA (uracil(1939)-C(5))-methyltransferase RlmD n=1 Tax=Mycoplasmopsis cynos TaxID=171284 RepID=UPI002AFFCF0C|nr:23S rRNA (uracil(1939)-C(5))-methyltransferase RlmD [Mycoplasmopsis cynos]WQQ12825.1 23S rRNA (uracil(1939)-C(5))-methyltransferase RlmD [Mycoplasmopsis cynos]WQQ14034.1 23S rRNA (uracil(1939)-C(5))-methyltransferase RlmD [Mycoplasmopsis cynos]